MQSDPRLIAALDFPTAEAAKQAVEEIGDAVIYYKVGMELYYAAGNEMIRFLKERGKKVFLDLKLQDIPNTVASALKVETKLGVDMINVHAVGGKKMMEAAAAAIREKASELGIERPKLLAVTILTSMDEEQFTDLNYKNTIAEQVLALAKLAKAAGLDGVVASPKEASGRQRPGRPEPCDHTGTGFCQRFLPYRGRASHHESGGPETGGRSYCRRNKKHKII